MKAETRDALITKREEYRKALQSPLSIDLISPGMTDVYKTLILLIDSQIGEP